MSDKAKRLEKIAEEVRNFKASPLYPYRQENNYLPVVGEGDPDASLLLIGEAPGQQEAATGRPFVGNAGRVLDRLLASTGIDRQDIYLTSVIKDRPPKNRDPRQEEIELYAPFLRQQIEIIEPAIIATLGRYAQNFILAHYDLPQQGNKIGELHGQMLTAQASFGPVTIVPLYHPAAAFYSQNLDEVMANDFQTLKRLLNHSESDT